MSLSQALNQFAQNLGRYRRVPLFMQKESSIGHNRMSVSVSLKK